MTVIAPIGPQLPPSGREPRVVEPDSGEPGKARVTALVAMAPSQPPAEDNRKAMRRNSVTFLAQLIANEKNLPQTRERRRADPQVAMAAYGAAARLTRRR